jgi:Leu/Phe-tRNA-protein transferase
LGAIEFETTARWYMDNFGLIPSDIQTLEDQTPVLAFMRCDRGKEPADHHTIVVAQNVANSYSHCAFEVIDLDDAPALWFHPSSRGLFKPSCTVQSFSQWAIEAQPIFASRSDHKCDD